MARTPASRHALPLLLLLPALLLLLPHTASPTRARAENPPPQPRREPPSPDDPSPDPQPRPADALDRVLQSRRIVFGSDQEGGAPFLFPRDDGQLDGFELDLIRAIGREIGDVEPVFKQAQWDSLLSVLERGDVDVVLNGYEKTPSRDERYLPTRPYYVYQLQLIARKDSPIRGWADLQFPKPGGGRWRVGVLGASGADHYAQRNLDPALGQVVNFDASTGALMAVKNGQIDATLSDLAPSVFYVGRPEFRDLRLAGPPEGCGYYVIYLKKDDARLRDALDRAIENLLRSGELQRIYQRWGIWNDAQTLLAEWRRPADEDARERPPWFDVAKLVNFGPALLLSAGMTILLACAAMPLAIVAGILIAVGRVYGPKPLAWLLRAYVEVIRGTPLMLQLYVLFYLLPELNVFLPAIAAGILGLAVNYSAYEAEIYRAGIQSIPKGQKEAALALGMTERQAVRRVVIPQAMRVVIPPVTNDFIAMFKDTSVCSVITLVELTKQYSILYNSHGGVVEFGLAAALIYLAMSLPLGQFSTWFEERLKREAKPAPALKPDDQNNPRPGHDPGHDHGGPLA